MDPIEVTPVSSEESATPTSERAKSKLDLLPKEELIKYVRKQMLMLKEAKMKYQSLTEDVQSLKNANSTLQEKENELKLNETMLEMTTVKEIQDENAKSLTIENRKLSEQLECMTMKAETLMTSFQALNEDQVKVEQNNQVLREDIDVMTKARNEALDTLKTVKKQHSAKLSELKVQLEQQISERSAQTEENTILKQKLQEANLKNNELILDNQSSQQAVQQVEADVGADLRGAKMELLQSLHELLRVRREEETHGESIRRLERETSEKDIEIERMQLEADALTTELQALKWARTEERSAVSLELNNEVMEANQNVTDLTASLAKMKAVVVELQGNCAEFESSNQALMTEKETLQHKIEEAIKENELLHEQKDEVDGSGTDVVAELHHEKEAILKQKDALISEYNLLCDKLKACADINSDLETKVKCYEEQVATLSSQQESHQSEKCEVESNLSSLGDALGESKSICEKLSSDNKSLTTTVGELEERNQSLETHLTEVSAELETYRRQVQELSATSETVTNDVENRLGEMQARIHELEAEQCKKLMLESEVQNLQELHNTFEDEKAIMSSQIHQYQESLVTLENEKSTIEAQIQSQEQEMQGLHEQVVTLSSQQESHQSEKCEVESNLTSLGDALGESRSICEKVSSDNKSLTTTVGELEERNQSLETHLQEVSAQLETSRRQVQELSDTSESVTNDVENRVVELQAQIHELESEVQNLRELQKTFENEKTISSFQIQSYKESCEVLENEKVNLESQIQCLQDCNETLENERVTFESKIQYLHDLQKTLNDEKEVLESDIRSIQESCKALEDENSVLQASIKSSQESISSLEDTKAALESEIQNLHESHEALENTSSAAADKLAALQEQLDLLTKSNGELAERLHESEADITSRADENARLLEAACSDRVVYERKEQTAAEMNEQLSAELHASRAETACLNEVVAELKASCPVPDARQDTVTDALDNSSLAEETERVTLLAEDAGSKEASGLLQDAVPAQSEPDDQEKEGLAVALKETEEKMAKFKMLAIKAKRELAAVKKQLEVRTAEKASIQQQLKEVIASSESIRSRLQQSMEHCQSLQRKNDELEDRLEASSEQMLVATKDLTVTVQELATVKQQYAEIRSDKERVSGLLDSLAIEKKDAEAKFLIADDQRQQASIKREEAQRQLEAALAKSAKLEEELACKKVEFREKLLSAVKEAKESSVMDLEIADYERTIAALQAKHAEKDAQIQELNCQSETAQCRVQALQEQLDEVDRQRSQADERGDKLKEKLANVKQELAQSRQIEADLKIGEASLKARIETLVQECEDYKMQNSELTSNKLKAEELLQSLGDSHQRAVRSLENQIVALQEDVQQSRLELSTCQAEYDGYKVRVHSVLKQQKTKPPSSSIPAPTADVARMEKAIEQLRGRCEHLGEQLAAAQRDGQLLQEERERLIARNARAMDDMQERERFWKERVERLRQEASMKEDELSQKIMQVTAQKDNIVQSFKDRLESMQTQHQGLLDLLHSQLEDKDNEIIRYQVELQSSSMKQQVKAEPTKAARTESVSPFEPFSIRRLEERQQAEGSEHNEQPRPPSPGIAHQVSSSSLVGLEQLLNNSDDKMSTVSLSSVASIDKEVLKSSLNTSYRKLDHVTGLLQESEETVARLTEQAKVLKQEIRRLERNQQREKHAQNLEYLKNVVMKFFSLQKGDEKRRLIPVLITMLRLSPEEGQILMKCATGEDGDAEGDGSGWGNYLHRWSGLT
ncbi:PREDICTED: GRIP and coiled-coil domain-containing protein 2-like isoform X2 [Priapulus caudatus]|uniref:GRIP and coiled-coil domain-containing protein 2-like isoform X2 n=1 Tax=Priapulus caudatus TaxID=37621 RepID=A0ABM1EVN8_PRICU|nr:PREDICTED: GRIP and coiled-coil domain-containing protein 2-like isoform X2 [Priapulus caudatus]